MPVPLEVYREQVKRQSVRNLQITRDQLTGAMGHLVLPDSQEMATFERVKEAVPELPVLVLTGLDDEALAEKAVAAGAREFLVKTQIDGESLARSIRAAVEV